jgi:hypothetical protein
MYWQVQTELLLLLLLLLVSEAAVAACNQAGCFVEVASGRKPVLCQRS